MARNYSPPFLVHYRERKRIDNGEVANFFLGPPSWRLENEVLIVAALLNSDPPFLSSLRAEPNEGSEYRVVHPFLFLPSFPFFPLSQTKSAGRGG